MASSSVGWNLDYSDLGRYREWQLEYIWLPNDHTYGSRAGKCTPVAYVATNDYAVGLILDAISHSRAWRSSALDAPACTQESPRYPISAVMF